MAFTDKKLNPEDIISSIQKILPVLDNWMNRTSESKESLNSAVDTSGLRTSLVGFDRTVLSIPDNICQRTRKDTQNAYYALYDILETDYNITTGQEIIERALEFRKQLGLCQTAMMNNNQGPAKTRWEISGKADLPNEKPAETWYWKLYEKTLKVILDAVLESLERMWHK